MGFIGGQLPFSPRLAVVYHNGISDAKLCVRGLTGLDKCNIPTGSKAAFLYYLLLFTYLFYFEVEVALTQYKNSTLCCVIMEDLFLLGVERSPMSTTTSQSFVCCRGHFQKYLSLSLFSVLFSLLLGAEEMT